MTTTLNDTITNTLKGKSIVIYEYDALFISQQRRISHWSISINHDFLRPEFWSDIQIKKHIGIIVSVSGYYMDYEGTSISMVVTINNEDKNIDINMEDKIELIEGYE
jgi:hypothetical protein